MAEPDGTSGGRSAEDSSAAVRLKDQAETFRDFIRKRQGGFSQGQPSMLRTVLTGAFILVLLSAVVLLIVDERSRLRLLALAVGPWADAYQRSTDEMVRLPSPPPAVVREPVRLPQANLPVVETEPDSGGVRLLDTQAGRTTEPSQDATPAVIAKNAANQAAYQLLLEESEVAGRLVAGELEQFQFQSWKPVKEEPPVFWLDLIALRQPGGREAHLIWSINVDSGQVGPLSQMARDLERP